MMEGPGLILPGTNRDSFLQTFDPVRTSWASAVIPNANAAHLVYVGRLGAAQRITTFQLSITASSGNLDIGIYVLNADGSYSIVGNLGSTASPGTGTQTFSPTAFTAPSGYDLVLSLVADNTTLSVPRFANPSATLAAFKRQCEVKAAAGVPLPSSIAADPGGSTYVPYILAF